jgi:8-oxo-dGTP pyrophosphatase MutT (NUDIX family)
MGLDPSAKSSAKSSKKSSEKSLAPSRLLKALRKERQQVAAVCYRIGKRGIEFLLVQTRSGRWIFPKGGVEPGLSHAQSAALEAFEEAGVHGRIETVAFARYSRSGPQAASVTKGKHAPAMAQEQSSVMAHLCEVSRLEPPQESNRNPTWFSAEKAQQRLLKDRAAHFGAELARVVVRAVSRIQRLQSSAHHAPNRTQSDRMQNDGLHRVRFEAHEDGHLHDDLPKAVLARYILRQRDARSSTIIETAVQAHSRKIPQLPAPEATRRPVLRLSASSQSITETARNVTAIDSRRKANPPNHRQDVYGKKAAGSRRDRSPTGRP